MNGDEEFMIKCIMTNNMTGNPNWWSMNYNMHDSPQSQQALNNSTFFSSQFVTDGSSPLALNLYAANHDLPHSWSQLLLGGLANEEDKLCMDQSLNSSSKVSFVDVLKQENSQLSGNSLFSQHGEHEEYYASSQSANWPQTMPVSSPRSCVTSLGNTMFELSHNKGVGKDQEPDQPSSECNSTATGGVSKKARVQSSSSQPTLKVRKEKVGDRVTALHQLVSPFGKTDTASVLLEVIGYIRFLHGQIEALSTPYLGNASGYIKNQHSGSKDVQRDDLRSRGLCLVPASYTENAASDNGADYWAPTIGGGF